MTTTQIQYRNLLETVQHNRNTEYQAAQELSEANRHNIESEKAANKQAKAALRTSKANLRNAKSNRMNAKTNIKNARTNAFNAEVNALNARTNVANAKTNARNAATRERELELQKVKVANDILTSEKYRNLLDSQAANYDMQTQFKAKELSSYDLNLLTKAGKAGQAMAAATLAAQWMSDPKSSPELKEFATNLMSALKGDYAGNSGPMKGISKGVKANKTAFSNMKLTYKNGAWFFVPRNK